MTNDTKTDFDFDDWAGLYIENPQEFEARRQAALMIELAKGSESQREAGKSLLKAFEKRVAGSSPQERLKVAGEMMADSFMELNTELLMLKKTLQDTADEISKEEQAAAKSTNLSAV